MAKYAVLGNHKAAVMGMPAGNMHYASGFSSPEEALQHEMQACAREGNTDCTPIAVDDTQLYNPVPGAGAAQQRREADAAAADANAAAMLPTVLQTLQGLKH